MILPVTEDNTSIVRGIGRSRTQRQQPRGPNPWAWAAALSLAGAVSFGAAEEPRTAPPAPGSGFVAHIYDMAEAATRISVPLNKSVIIETSVPLQRVQAVSADIAYVQSISSMQLLVTGNTYGVTHVIAWTEAGDKHVFEVSVELDVAALNEALKKIEPVSTAEASSVMGNIMLSGRVSGPETTRRMAQLAELFLPHKGNQPLGVVQNHLTVGGEQQVLLRCTVAEVNRTAVRALGINGFMAGDDFQDAFVVNQIGGLNPANIGAAGNVNVQNKIPFLTGSEGIPLRETTTLSLGFPRVQMQVFLRAMVDNSLLRILAEPNLVAISGETASFLAGGEFPIPVPQSGAATGAITIEYKEFGVKLNFTPVVLDHQRIRLRVAPEVSEQDFSAALQLQGFAVPGLTQRRAETTIEIGNGQTIAIAGLLDDEVRGVVSEIPGIGEVPVLGALFRSTEYRRRITELVILVTPEIIAPMNPDQVDPVPGQFLTTPNDFELYALGLLEGPELEEAAVPADALNTATPPRVGPYTQTDELSIHGPWGHETTSGL
jgi:pilus assembly protein CpaC